MCNVLDKLFDLEHPGRTLTTVVKDLNGKVIGSDTKVPQEIEKVESSRQCGRSRSVQDLRRYVNEKSKVNKPQKRKVRKFVVEKTCNRKGWESTFQSKPFSVDGEIKHTVRVGNLILQKRCCRNSI